MEPKILVPVDNSPTARRTLGAIIELKDHFPRELTLLHVIDDERLTNLLIPDYQIEMFRVNAAKAGTMLLKQADVRLREAGFSNNLLLEYGKPWRVISGIAKDRGFQLVVIGRHEGGGEIRDVLFGSVANHILHNVKCPVLLF